MVNLKTKLLINKIDNDSIGITSEVQEVILMHKLFKTLMCVGMSLALMGCSINNIYSRSATNQIESVCSNCKQVTNVSSLMENVEQVMGKVQAIKGNYELINTKETFEFSYSVITKDKKVNWELSADLKYGDTMIQFYARDKKFYVVYPYNGANVILKDDIQDMVVELEDTLDNLNATYDKDNLSEVVTGDKLAGLDFTLIKENGSYEFENGVYVITYVSNGVVWELDISSNFLIKEIRSSASNFTSKAKFEYPETLTITYPNGLDFITLDIADAKNLLEIESFAQLIDPNL